jgi:hypothetical protein
VRRFSDETREALRAQGWRLAVVPAEARLKGGEIGEVAYRPGLMPGSPGEDRESCAALLARLDGMLPPGAKTTIGSAAAYEWLLADHHARTGEWLLTRCFTWSTDTDARGYPVAVGAFGGARPILTSALPERRGRGTGLLPLVLPR